MARMGACWIVVALLGVAALAQEPKPKFEVASVRRAVPGETGGRVQFLPGGRFRAQNVSLDFLIQQVYSVRDFQIVAAPEWRAVLADGYGKRYFIEATSSEPATEQDIKEMVQALLADRFALKLHRETREFPVYNLVVAKSGLKGARAADGPPGGIASMLPGWIRGQGVAMAFLAEALSRYLDRPVVNRTNVEQVLDFDLTWTPEALVLAGNARDAGFAGGECPADFQQMAARVKFRLTNLSCPTIFVAVEEQLGLRLEPARGPINVLVIDSVQQPTEN